ncbi:MAG: hypothetical protein HY908_05915 [Myxococcales bacterium]|nr:hypothetical protein [Myxococcales bacterium]
MTTNRNAGARVGVWVSAAVVSLGTAGCFPSGPQLGVIKNPNDPQCAAADCPTLEIPAPNTDNTYTIIKLVDVDGGMVSFPMVWGDISHVWWVMKLAPGAHKITVSTEEKKSSNVGMAILEGLAATRVLDFEAVAGKRYWLWGSRRSPDASFDAWLEEGTLDRTFVAGTDGIETDAFQKFLEDLGGSSYELDARLWWATAPQVDRIFQRTGDVVGDTEAFGLFPSSFDAVPAHLKAK